jgi:hypothetical protein
VPWIRGLAAETLLWRLEVNPRPSHVELAVDKLTLKQGIPLALAFYSINNIKPKLHIGIFNRYLFHIFTQEIDW